jgi:redox-sensitive bicupin YhaK (pirin superfamily)
MTAIAKNTGGRRRDVEQIIRGRPAMDGAGVRLTRVIGTSQLDHLDPFLLFDVFESDNPDDYIAGFPPHPHRGFETVTYMLAGKMEHRDSVGNRGVIETGGVQWMTAAKGIIHSEMPRQQDGLLRGVQIWVNLPADLKLAEPGYREFAATEIPQQSLGGVQARIIAGELGGESGPVRNVVTQPLFLDLSFDEAGRFSEALPVGHSAIVFVVEGAVAVQGEDRLTEVKARHLAVLGEGDQLELGSLAAGTRVLLMAAARIGEPVARSGPFVMNTPEEIVQAFRDYQSGRLAQHFELNEA